MKLPLALTTFKPLLTKIRSSGIVLCIIGWFALLLFIWLKGEHFSLGEYKPLSSLTSRWLTTAILIIIAISFITWKVIQRLRTLEARQQEDKQQKYQSIKPEIDAQRRYFDHWVNQFKRHINQQDYAYFLPWYLILGIEDSGKTTLLQEGGNFTKLYNDEEGEQQVNFSIFTNKQAVVINPNHNLIEQLDNIEEKPKLYKKLWGNLLHQIAEQRARQPLNGIILTIDIHRLLVSDKAQKEMYVKLLSQRLQDIFEITQGALPIYLIMTKLDILHGFDSIYHTLNKEQKDAALGISFSQHGENWKIELEHFWNLWISQMNVLLPSLLYQTTSEKRSQLFSYVRQLATAMDICIPFLESLMTNKSRSFHFLKGVYLTSATQKGKIDDIFVQSASEQYHLGRQTYPIWGVKNTQPYFCNELFEQVIFSYPNLAQESQGWIKQYRSYIKTFCFSSGILALALLGSWHYFYYKNYQAGINVLEQVKEFKAIPISSEQDHFGDKQLPLLNPIREATLSYGNYHDKSYIFKDMGLYQGNDIGPYVESTYLRLLQLRFIPAIMSGLLIELNNAPAESEEKLEILRVMRMLDDKTGRDNRFVKEFMRNYWSNEFPGQKGLQDNLMLHLDYALQHTNWFNGRLNGDEILIEAYQPYDLSIKDAQIELARLSIYDRVYQNLKIKANTVLAAPLNYRDEIGSGFDTVYMANNEQLLKIPRFFTEHGLKNYFVKQNEHLIDLIAMDSWVLNLKENMEYSDADRQRISERISEQYVNDYISTWRSALNNLDIRDFANLEEAISAIEKITGGEQTIKRALVILSENTLPPILPDKEGKELQEAINTLEYRLMSQIDHSFAEEKSVLNDAENKNSALQDIYQKLSDLHRYLLSIHNAPDSGKAALQAVKLRIDQHSSDPILELQQLAKTQPQPISRWLGQLAEYSWRAVLKSAIVSLEVEWNNKVVKLYKTYIDGRYPFSDSAQEVPLSEFTRFFAPNGILDEFYQHNLKPFIESDLTELSEDHSPLIRNDVVEQLMLAQEIRDTFFNTGNGIGIQFTIEPINISANKRRSVLNLDGQIIDYSHGLKKQTNIVWPNSMNANVESKLTLVPTSSNAPRSLIFKGPWAQMKLLTTGKISNEKEGSFDIRYDVDGGYATYRVHIDASDNPFSKELFKLFKLPETLY